MKKTSWTYGSSIYINSKYIFLFLSVFNQEFRDKLFLNVDGMRSGQDIWTRVAPDTDLAGYPATGYPANIFTGYPVSG